MTLKEGTTGMNLKVTAVGSSNLKQRLMSMGVVPGVTVKVLRSAPFGDPMAIRVRSYNLAMRREDAEKIEVEQVSGAC